MADSQSQSAEDLHPKQNKNIPEKSRLNLLIGIIINHYTYTPIFKKFETIENEKWLLPSIPFNRWMCLPAAFMTQFCVGSMYSWSVLNQPIDLYIYGKVKNIAPITFYVTCSLAGASAAVMGPWLERRGPKVSCLLGTMFFCSGHFLTSLALYMKQMWLIFIGYGIIGGSGIGLCYISPISCLQKWFPDRRGLASGLSICGFGAGSIVFSKVQLPLINLVGLPLTFVLLATFYTLILTLASLILRTPPPDFEMNAPTQSVSFLSQSSIVSDQLAGHLTLIEALKSRDFLLIYLAFFANILFGLCILSRLSNIISDIFGKSVEEASTIVSINGCFNLGGRLLFPVVSDFVGRKMAYIITLTSQLIIVALFSIMTSYGAYECFVFSIFVLTSCYGGGFGCLPAFLADKFDPKNIGALHGVALTAWSLSGIAGGFVYTQVFNFVVWLGYSPKGAVPYNVNSWWIFCLNLLGWTAVLFVGPTEKDLGFRRKVGVFFKRICFLRRASVGNMIMVKSAVPSETDR